MKIHMLFIPILLSGCASAFLEHNCNVLFSNDIEYCKKEYATSQGVMKNAAHAVSSATVIKAKYELNLIELQQPDKPLLGSFKAVEGTLLSQLENTSNIWSQAITDSASSHGEDFNTVLAVSNKEFDRVGASKALTDVKNGLREKMSDYDSAKFPSTFQLYAVISQMISLAQEPRGSLQTFNQTINTLQSDFSRYYSLAELENPVQKLKVKKN